MKISEISEHDALELIKNADQDGPFEPKGLFWYRDRELGHYVAIDNSTGCAFVEEFGSLDSCLKYLRREACTALNGFTY